jgi:hypothetical protein
LSNLPNYGPSCPIALDIALVLKGGNILHEEVRADIDQEKVARDLGV